MPAWSTGHISGEDATFLAACVAMARARVVLEIGVAAGVSSAVILAALDALGDGAARRLVSVDTASRCYFNSARPVGAAVAEMYPAPRAAWQLETGMDARTIGRRLEAGAVDLVFIDATHEHPAPLLDVLHVVPWVRPEAWIVLHDIALPRLYPQYRGIGAQWLFEAWPAPTFSGGPAAPNIGAVQRPAQLEELIPVALELVARAWQMRPRAADVDLPVVFGAVQAAIAGQLRP